jgi:succinate-semialdehyde dehydrogenase
MLRFAQKANSLGSAISKLSVVDRLRLVRTMHSLVKSQAFVNGKWLDASDNERFNVTNPANQKIVGVVPDMNVGDVEKAIDAAYETFHSKDWQNTTAKERSGLLKVS